MNPKHSRERSSHTGRLSAVERAADAQLEKVIAGLDPALQEHIRNNPTWRARLSSSEGPALRQAMDAHLRSRSFGGVDAGPELTDAQLKFLLWTGGIGVLLFFLWATWPIWLLAALSLAMLLLFRYQTKGEVLGPVQRKFRWLLVGITAITTVVLALHAGVLLWDWWQG
jgi:hypothetical protein